MDLTKIKKKICASKNTIKDATVRSSNFTSVYIQKEMKIGYQKDICTPKFITALFIIAKIWIQPKCTSVGEWMKKMQHVQYTAM